MAQTANSQEPTMEEILASIRRIISEDGDEEKPAAPAAAKPAAAAPAARPAPKPAPAPVVEEEEDEVLELTDIVPDEEPLPRRAEPSMDDLVMVDRSPPASKPMPRARYEEDSQLISDRVREQAQGAFMQLARNVLVTESDPRSLEALVQEMLRPMLQTWLNENLPQIVEGMVAQEIERVSRRGRL